MATFSPSPRFHSIQKIKQETGGKKLRSYRFWSQNSVSVQQDWNENWLIFMNRYQFLLIYVHIDRDVYERS